MKQLEDLNVKGKSVFLRVDFNVPLDDACEIISDTSFKNLLISNGSGMNEHMFLTSIRGRGYHSFGMGSIHSKLNEGKKPCIAKKEIPIPNNVNGILLIMLEILRNIWNKIISFFSGLFRGKHGYGMPPYRSPVRRGSAPAKEKIKTIKLTDEHPSLKSSYSVVNDFQPVVTDAMSQVFEVQKGTIRLLLGYLNINYVPQLALDLIEELKQDPVNCFFEFLRRLRINPDRLLVDRSPIEMQKIEDSTGVLLEADEIRREYDVSPIPIYKALLESVTAAEQMLDKMRLVATTLSRLNQKKAIFFEYSQWLDSLRDNLEQWEKYSTDEIEEVLDNAEQYERSQNQYENLKASIDNHIGKLESLDNPRSLKPEVVRRIREIQEIESHLLNVPPLGETDIRFGAEKCLRLIAAIAEELRDFYISATGRTYASDGKMTPAEARRILGVSEGATIEEVKKKRNELVKTYHSDLNPGNLTYEEKMKEINTAYDILVPKKHKEMHDD